MSLARDLSVSAVTAGFVTVLVGFASSAVIVFRYRAPVVTAWSTPGAENQREPALVTFLVTRPG